MCCFNDAFSFKCVVKTTHLKENGMQSVIFLPPSHYTYAWISHIYSLHTFSIKCIIFIYAFKKRYAKTWRNALFLSHLPHYTYTYCIQASMISFLRILSVYLHVWVIRVDTVTLNSFHLPVKREKMWFQKEHNSFLFQ